MAGNSVRSAKVLDELRPSSGRRSRAQVSQNQESSVTVSSDQDLQVYVEDIPTNIPENDLEIRIQSRLEATQNLKIKDIRCCLKLGVAVIRLINEEDKVFLVSKLETIVLYPKTNTIINFIGEIDLDSYVVVDRNISKVPSADDVARRYMQSYKTREPPPCKSISIQFPNIFRISLTTLDELSQVASAPDFKIENVFATVYPRSDCSFFEDLPSNTNAEKLSSVIAAQIEEKKLAPTSFYVQYDSETSNAVVLATKSNKKWNAQNFLTIDGRNISKKIKLAYRVVVSPVPSDFGLDCILNHKLFASRTVGHSHIVDHLIIELDGMDNYEECLAIGALRIGKTTMTIKPHSVTSDPDSSELNAENWYETEMNDIKPDIVTIMSDHQHPIFRYKWSAENWLEQMKKMDTTDRRSKKYDLGRHLLRVTVMLNTISVLRKKNYILDDEEVTLKLQRMRTIGYDHKSKLSYTKTISEAELTTPYPSTSVIVSNEDCLVIYEKLVREGYRPLLLNMANANSPGGGYRKGDGAQEENIFRRSDYYQSLDLEIADKDRSERLFCTPKCEFKKPTGYAGLYPMEEFGGIYTSGITVFRGTEANGYPYMKEPLYNVCSIAMAAHREPALTNKNMLEKKMATSTHKKIDSIFAIGHHHKHDCLVLSALGCGAFKNPPEHVALLFKSIIYQYAGYFEKIYFAIIDDHNTGNRINPKGNFIPFKEILDGLIVHPSKIIQVNGASGPYRILKKLPDGKITLSDSCIQHLPPCYHGTECRDIKDTQHNTTFSHPPICLYQTSNLTCDQMEDEVHMLTFFHRMKCKRGGECNNTDPQHLNDLDHPEFCKKKSDCVNVSAEHLFAYRHLPVCHSGITCLEYKKKIPAHLDAFRHCKTICADDNCCPNFHDREHFKNTIHSFQEPCSFTPYNCPMFFQYIQAGGTKIPSNVEYHCLTYSHVCQFGRLCKTTGEAHYATSIHVARQLCPDRDMCSRLADENHLESFSHPGIRDIRLFCRNPGYECPDRYEDKHLRTYRHGRNFNHLSVAPSSNLNRLIDFFRNQGNIIKTVNNYVEASNWAKAKISEDILNWIRALQPVHRCAPHIFTSILVHGHVMSRDYMSLLIKPRCVVQAVLQHSQVRSIFLRHSAPAVRQNAKELIKLLVRSEFLKAGSAEVPTLDADHDNQVNIIQKKLKPPLEKQDIQTIYDWTAKIVAASIELSQNLAGIGFDVDKKLRTDKHVFSILGPHCGTYYGDIVITFKQELMFHPDSNFSFQAGTGFFSGRVYAYRPWLTDPTTEEQRIEHFHHSKLHCSYPRYEYAAAAELIASTGKNNKTMDVDLDSIIKKWTQADSHYVFEGHLPPLIPLDYVDNVFMPKNVFQSLPKEAQESAKEIFKDSLILGEHDVDLTLIKPGTTTPLDTTRQVYLKWILDKLSEKINERIKAPHISRGIVITVPGTGCDKYIALPMTITQSYNLYCLNKGQPARNMESSYIYWQAMNGDMILTITNEKIEIDGKDQPNLQCLICYVAEKPSSKTDTYFEAYSYLTVGNPYQHSNNVDSATFKAKSNCFYRGCNTDDFFTFCLKINYKTGEVSLTHAGPNGIYNHENIYYQFKKSEVDLLGLNYIHISAGKQDVPIRNLTINHEPIDKLHPTFDRDFKLDTLNLIRARRASFQYTGGTTDRGGDKDVHSSDASPKPIKKAASTVDLHVKLVDPPATPGKTTKPKKRGFFERLKYIFMGTTKGGDPPESKPPPSSSSSNLFKDNESKSDSSSYNPSKFDSPPPKSSKVHSSGSKPVAASSVPLISSALPLCADSIYCLIQNERDHTDKYSHFCRFNELCRNQAGEPHLVHKKHNVPKCLEDKSCSERTNPVHRAEYRHSGLPDYLIPCHFQDTCYDKTPDHRLKFFHGEEIPRIRKSNTPKSHHVGAALKAKLPPCRHGNECRSMKNTQHTARFSHPTS
ncbi:unnamed protein product [Rotaria socialis]|uniref:Microbial-type PARG catalytic domain-containing protein n=1 Tax=Rotaria socialis TaxID=392032 RepID=A0A820IBN2_9BILA|nr:unnamed protein product [Rotaria socialis]CAF4308593.1 unnamed protein product [Rotaria socialis]